MRKCDDVFITGYRYKNIPDFNCVPHSHDRKSVHDCLKCFNWINFNDNYMCSHTSSSGRKSPSAPPVAAYHEFFSGEEHIGCPHNPVKRRLPGALAIVEHVLRVTVVNGKHGDFKRLIFFHRPKTN